MTNNLIQIDYQKILEVILKTVKSSFFWLKTGLILCTLYLLFQKEFNHEFTHRDDYGNSAGIIKPGIGSEVYLNNSTNENTKISKAEIGKSDDKKTLYWWDEIKFKSNENQKTLLANEATAVSNTLSKKEKELAAKLSNLSVVFSSSEALQKKGFSPEVIEMKMSICNGYITQYLNIAIEEAEIFNIPVSITLAQGLLESNAGESKLAKKENNHFGIKCKNKCIGCRCANYSDDDRFDMFRIYDSPWHSFREHSKLILSNRYKHLTKLKRTDYKSWAKGLKKAGYATDVNYAEKLIKIIEFFKLNQHDK
jgi:flagellum-specific peptidoglycan hydrolase FlgJ